MLMRVLWIFSSTFFSVGSLVYFVAISIVNVTEFSFSLPSFEARRLAPGRCVRYTFARINVDVVVFFTNESLNSRPYTNLPCNQKLRKNVDGKLPKLLQNSCSSRIVCCFFLLLKCSLNNHFNWPIRFEKIFMRNIGNAAAFSPLIFVCRFSSAKAASLHKEKNVLEWLCNTKTSSI